MTEVYQLLSNFVGGILTGMHHYREFNTVKNRVPESYNRTT